MSTWKTCPAVERDPEKASGAWVFRGTRVPVSALFENLRKGATIDQHQPLAVLDHEREVFHRG